MRVQVARARVASRPSVSASSSDSDASSIDRSRSLGHHQDARELLEDVGLRGRRAAHRRRSSRAALEVLAATASRSPRFSQIAAEPRLGLGGRLDLAGAQDSSSLASARTASSSGDVVDAAARVGEQQLRPLVVVRRPELERRARRSAGRGGRRRARAPGRRRREPPAAPAPRARRSARRPRLAPSSSASQVVVREHLRVVLGPAERLDPLRGQLDAARARAARGIWPYATSRTSTWRNAYSSSPPTDERRSRRTNSLRSSACRRSLDLAAVDARPPRTTAPSQNTFPSTAASCSSSFSSGGQAVEPRGDDALHGLRQRKLLVRCRAPRACARTARRRAGCRPRASSSDACGSAGSTERSSRVDEQPRRLVVGERRERERQRVGLAAAPPRPALEQLGPRRADDEQRDAARPVDQVVDEVEQAVVGPVQVLEDEHRGRCVGERLEELPPGGERARRAPPPARRRRRGRRAGARCREQPLGVAPSSAADRLASFSLGLLRRVRLEDPGLRLHHLGERPEADALAVRQRAPLPPVGQAPAPRRSTWQSS